MWPFGEIDRQFKEKDDRWKKAEARLNSGEVVICIISGRHVIYKDKKGFLKSFEIES